ncbi:MAG: hypothetical protein ACRD04_13360 [Terriglobales bacterium]
MRFWLCTLAGVVLAGWFTLAHLRPRGPNPWVLQVPATYLSVGQQFQPRLVSLAPSPQAVSDRVRVELFNHAGVQLASLQLRLAPAGETALLPLSLPLPGSYLLRASSATSSQSIALHALPDPGAGWGGVLPVAALGVPKGVADYLREHSFALTPADIAAPVPGSTRLILVGQPGLGGSGVAARYAWLWQQAANGDPVLLLEPPTPALAHFWPLAPPLVASGAAGCSDVAWAPALSSGLDAGDGLQRLLRPPLRFDFSRKSDVALYRLDGHLLLDPNRVGKSERCQPLVSYRLGSGWVTQTTLPLLQHFQDVRARVVLMNLITAAAARKRYAPPSPGLAWVMRQRLQQLARAAAPPTAAVYYRAPPAAVESAPVLLPLPAPGGPVACSSLPSSRRAGASLTLELGAPQAVERVEISAPELPPARLESSADGEHWTPLPSPRAGASATVAVPAGQWRAFRLTLTAPAAAWKLCGFTAR